MTHLIVFGIVLAGSLGFFVYSCRRLVKYLTIGKKEERFDRPGDRIKNVLRIAFGQTKLLREPAAGLMHFFIFWGFVILLTAILEALIQGFVPGFSLAVIGPVFPALAVLQETVGILVVLASAAALIRWYVFPPKRFFGPEVTDHVRADATLILGLILVIMVSMFGTFATHMVLAGEETPYRYVSIEFARLFQGPETATAAWFGFFWWTHILVVLGFLNYLPFSKHLHVLTSLPNVYFSSLAPRGELTKLDLEDENAEKFGSDDVSELTWKQLLDGYTCTDCGRCTSVCPANQTGKVLSPRKIMMNIRERTMEAAPVLLAASAGGRTVEVAGGQAVGAATQPETAGRRLLDDYVTEEELWACTTCRACMEECPVNIEHVPAIVDMRRYLVLTESRFPAELTATFKNLETNGNPWAFSPSARADWAEGLDVPLMADAADGVDLLYWVGCAGSYDQRYMKVSRAMVRLLKAAGVRFAILGNEEKCTGDPARRAGNEYLAQMMMMENVETLNGYKVKKIVASCPHCYNTLKNEYPQFGGRYEVVHHTELLDELVRSGKLRLKKNASGRTTFHDSCYIGRYNHIYREPRSLLSDSGADLIEMKRSESRGFCCGAGGARMFMEETVGKRVNVERTEEALRCDPKTIATACPFCMTMLTDGLKAKDAEEKVGVRDIAEILAEAL